MLRHQPKVSKVLCQLSFYQKTVFSKRIKSLANLCKSNQHHKILRLQVLTKLLLEYMIENSIFLRLTEELAGKYALIGIYVCMCFGMCGILAGVFIIGLKE